MGPITKWPKVQNEGTTDEGLFTAQEFNDLYEYILGLPTDDKLDALRSDIEGEISTLDEAQTIILNALNDHIEDTSVHVTSQAKEHWNAVYADWNEHDWVDASELAPVATSGSYNDLTDKPPYISLERLRPYLYRVTFDSLPEDNGSDSPVSGGCSSYVQDGKLYRNLDFNYDNAASFIVRTKDFEGMSFITGLNDGNLDNSLIAQLPYRMVDGCNNNGIKVSTHVLYNDWQWTGVGSKTISLTRLPFLVLSKVRSMATIATDLNGVLGNLYASAGLLATGYLIQVLVTDGTTTYAILPPTSEGQAFVLQDITSNPKLANFRWVNRATVVRTDNDIQTRPTGVERWNAMPCELSDLRFTKAYEQPTRLSEFIGLRNTTKASTDAALTAIYNDARELYLDRKRDGVTWQTMHSVVYGSKMEELYIQENWDDNCIIPESIIVDDALSTTSTHPVQNKAIVAVLDKKADLVEGKVPSSQLPAMFAVIRDGEGRELKPADTAVVVVKGKGCVSVKIEGGAIVVSAKEANINARTGTGGVLTDADAKNMGKVMYWDIHNS